MILRSMTMKWVVMLILAVSVFSALGCGKPPQVNYDRWKNVSPDIEIDLPSMKSGKNGEIAIPKMIAKAGKVIRFHGSLVRDSDHPILGSLVRVTFSKRYNGRDLSFDTGSSNVSFRNGETTMEYSIFVKTPPKAGTYKTTVKVSNTDGEIAIGSLQVQK